MCVSGNGDPAHRLRSQQCPAWSKESTISCIHSFRQIYLAVSDTFITEITNRQVASLAEAFRIRLFDGLQNVSVCKVSEHAQNIQSRLRIIRKAYTVLHFGTLCGQR